MSVDLDNLLSQVPYQVRHRVKLDIVSLKAKYNSLNPQVGTLIHNNGSESRLVLLTGTVPIRYMGHEYHIPIEIFIPEAYPNLAPKIYVRPTPNMIVKPGHKHVDSEGLVYMPYLMSWIGVSCSLVGLCDHISAVFSSDPPLYSKPASPMGSHSATTATATATVAATVTSANPTLSRRPSSMAQYYAQLQGGAGTSAGYGAAGSSASPVTASSGGYGASPPAYAGVASVVTAGVGATPSYTANTLGGSDSYQYTEQAGYRRKELVRKVTHALQTELAVALTSLAAEVDREMEEQVTLEHTKEHTVRAELRALEAQQWRCREKRMEIVETKSRELDAWVLQMDPSAKLEGGSVAGDDDDADPEDAASVGSKSKAGSEAGSAGAAAPPKIDRLVPYDALSAQLVRLLAEQNAIEDAIYSLDHALAHGTDVLDVTTFLKRMRELGRKQFLCKLHAMKISSALEASAAVGSTPGSGKHGFGLGRLG